MLTGKTAAEDGSASELHNESTAQVDSCQKKEAIDANC